MAGKVTAFYSRDLTGAIFSDLTVDHMSGEFRGSNTAWSCMCACGERVERTSRKLLNGTHHSCGCYTSKRVAAMNTTHGNAGSGRRTLAYKAWLSMHCRCSDSYPKRQYYKGRGISVCERWSSFENFVADMGEPPYALRSLDRINNDGNYEPSNCRWTTSKVQCNNKSNNIYLTYWGFVKTCMEWSELMGVNYHLIRDRVLRGWTHERAITTPPDMRFSCLTKPDLRCASA